MKQQYDQHENGRITNINQFTPLFDSDGAEGTNPSPKPKKTPVILLSEDEDADEHKRDQKYNDEVYDGDGLKEKMVRTNDLDNDNELNGDFGIAEFDDNRDNDDEAHITRANF